MSWFHGWFGPIAEAVAPTPVTPTPPILGEVVVASDPATVDHLEAALERLCEQFKGD